MDAPVLDAGMNAAQWAAAVGALMSAIAAVAAVVVAHNGAKFARNHARTMLDPVILVYLRPSSRNAPWPELVIENAGPNPAFNVRFDSNDNELGKLIGEHGRERLSVAIPILAAHSRLVYDIIEPVVPERCLRGQVTVYSRYHRSFGSAEELRSESLLSMEPLVGVGLEVNANPIRLLEYTLRDCRDVLNRIETSLRREAKASDSPSSFRV